MVFDLEEKFGIQIPYNANSAATDFATVGDVVKAIQGLVDAEAANVNWPHRVVVTGCGVVSPVGKDTASYWAALTEGRSGIAQPTVVAPELLLREVVAEVKDYVPTAYFEERQLSPLDRVSQFAVIAAREALARSGLDDRRGAVGAHGGDRRHRHRRLDHDRRILQAALRRQG